MRGHELLTKIEDVGDKDGAPTVTVKIINCGEYGVGMNKKSFIGPYLIGKL